MTRLGLATAALALAFFSSLTVAAAQGAPPAQDEPNTLQNPDAAANPARAGGTRCFALLHRLPRRPGYSRVISSTACAG
jgi:hypothetical protein